MFRKQLYIWLVVLLICSFIFIGGAINAVAAETLKFGAIWGLTGPGSQLQLVQKDGAVLAVEWINSKGGITVKGKKYKIELVVEDDKNTAEGSAGAATKLVHRDNLKFITGMTINFKIEAVQTVTEPNRVILSTSRCAYLLPKNSYTFSTSNPFPAAIPGLYDFLLKTYPSVKTVGFTAIDEPGALQTLKAARAAAEGHRLKLLDTILTQYGAKDYYPTWTKLLNDKPDAVDIGINFPDLIAATTRHGRELGFKGPIFSPITGDSNMFVNLIGKDFATDFLFAGFDLRGPECPRMMKEIMNLWEEKYKNPFIPGICEGWNSVWALAQAIEKAQSFDIAEVVKTWENMKSIETPWGTGTMGGARTYGINHMVVAPMAASRVRNGRVDITHWFKPDIP